MSAAIETAYFHYGPAVLLAAGAEIEVHAQIAERATWFDEYAGQDGADVTHITGIAHAPPGLDLGSDVALRLPDGTVYPLVNVQAVQRAEEGDTLVMFWPPPQHTSSGFRGLGTV